MMKIVELNRAIRDNGGYCMEIIEQTNRTILFDVVNPEVFNMFNIM